MLRVEAVILISIGLACGCSGRTDTQAPPAETATARPASDSTNPSSKVDQRLEEFEPLAPADVDLYLKVMRTASDRLQHLSPEDTQALRQFRDMTVHPPAAGAVPSEAQLAAIQRAGELISLDATVARELGVEQRFSSISSRVSRFVGPRMSGEGDEPLTAEEKVRVRERTAKFRELEKADSAVLAPHRDELERLDKQVHFIFRPE